MDRKNSPPAAIAAHGIDANALPARQLTGLAERNVREGAAVVVEN
jgi:hypothetical protein